MNEWLLHGAFALGGGLGSVARYLLTTAVTHRFPVSTLIVNVSGSLLLGLLMSVLMDAGTPASREQLRIGAGFCGGFTTFSSFAYQSFDLRRTHTLLHAAANILVNLVTCVAAFLLGRWAGAQLA
jgi:CrcB protein